MAGVQTTINANDYNTIQSKVGAVLGSGSDDFGYGQIVSSSQALIQTPISLSIWNNLRTDLIKARQHQTGATNESANLLPVSTGVPVSDATRASFATMSDLLTTDRLIIPPVSQRTTNVITAATRTTPWNNSVIHTVTVNFVDVDGARYFFNSGGSIDISASRTGGSVDAKNTSWADMLSTMGTISLRRNTATVVGTGDVTIAGTIGWSDLTTTNQFLFSKTTDAPVYEANEYVINVKQGTSAAQIVFDIQFQDLSSFLGTPPPGVDQNIDGTLTSTIQATYASGNNVSVLAPVAVGTMTGGAVVPIYHVSPSVTSVNEGSTVTFSVTTNDVPDNTTLYWKIDGTVIEDDFTDNLIEGEVLINNSVGSFTKTMKNDFFTDGVENFTVRLLTDSLTGPIVANSTQVLVNDTSYETYAISPPTGITSVNEGSTIVFTVTTAGVPDNTTLYWKMTGIASTLDFSNLVGLTSGSVVINSNTGSIPITATADLLTEGPETFQLELRTGSINGPLKATSNTVTINDTSIEATYAVSVTPAWVNEGGSFVVNVSTVAVTNGTTLYWTIIGSGSYPATAADFSPAKMTGTVVITTTGQAGTGSFTLTAASDSLTDGSQEAFQVQIRTGSATGLLRATSTQPSLINDTSITPIIIKPSYDSVIPNVYSVNEGNTVIFAISTTNVLTTEVISWALSGTSATAADINGPLSGTFSVNAQGKASISIPIANDLNSDGTKTLVMRITSANGSITTASQSVTVNDSSPSGIVPNPTISVKPDLTTSVNEGSTVTYTVTTTDWPSAETLTWVLTGSSATAADIVNGTLTGTFTVPAGNNAVTIPVGIRADLNTDGQKTIGMTIKSGAVIKVTSIDIPVNDISLTPVVVNIPTYSVTPTVQTAANEGTTVTFGVTTTFVSNSTPLTWELTGTAANSGDVSGLLSGSFNVTNGSASIPVAIIADSTTDGQKTLGIVIKNAGAVMHTSANYLINDSSPYVAPVEPTYNIVANKYSVAEGDIITCTVTTTNVSNRTLYWQASGPSPVDFTNNVYHGSFSLVDGYATFPVKIATDTADEGDESFRIVLQSNGNLDGSGDLKSTPIITINGAGAVDYAANGTFVVPAGITTISVRAIGGGGGGGGTSWINGTASAAFGGGAGGWVLATIKTTPTESLTITVGGGGAAGSEPTKLGDTYTGYTTGGKNGGHSLVKRGTAVLVKGDGGGGAPGNVYPNTAGIGGKGGSATNPVTAITTGDGGNGTQVVTFAASNSQSTSGGSTGLGMGGKPQLAGNAGRVRISW